MLFHLFLPFSQASVVIHRRRGAAIERNETLKEEMIVPAQSNFFTPEILMFMFLSISLLVSVLVYFDQINAFQNHFYNTEKFSSAKCKIPKDRALLHYCGVSENSEKSFITRPITTDSTYSQALFTQGQLHIYGFNRIEGERNFRAALVEDKNCAMCYFGLAASFATNLNTVMNEDMYRQGREAILFAIEKLESRAVSEVEAVLIHAQSRRFSAETVGEWNANGQSYYDRQYSAALQNVSALYPNDLDVSALWAESILNLSPWDYFKTNEQALTQY